MIYLIYFKKTIKYVLDNKQDAIELVKIHLQSCKYKYAWHYEEYKINSLEQILNENPKLLKKQQKLIMNKLSGE